MNELETMVFRALNKPGMVGKCLTVTEVFKDVCRQGAEKLGNNWMAFEARNGFSNIRPITKKQDKIIVASDEIKEKLKNREYILALMKKINDDKVEIIDVVDFYSLDEIQAVLQKFEVDGIAFRKHNTYRNFPAEKGYVQGNVYFDDNNNGIVYGEDGTYFINSFDLAGVLNEDLVVVAPCNKRYGEHTVAKIEKVVKRRDGLLSATVVVRNGEKQIKADNKIFYYALKVDSEMLERYEEGDRLLVRVSVPVDKKITAEVVRLLGPNEYLEGPKQNTLPSNVEDYQEKEIIQVNVMSVLETQEKILEYISRNVTKAYSYNDIWRNVLKRVNNLTLKKEIFESALKDLEVRGAIVLTSKGLYRVLDKNLGFIQGKIKINKFGEGLLEDPEGVRYLVDPEDLCDALDGDLVLIKPTGKTKAGRVISKVDKIVKRKDGLVVVEVTEDKDGELYLRPFNAKLSHPIKISNYNMKPLVVGDRILVKIDDLANSDCYYAGFIKNIGHKDDPDADLKVIAIQNNIIVDFSPEALEEAERLPIEVLPEERKGRIDLTDKLIYSIDGASTKDRDDAISIEELPNGNYQVGVHISDVTHYIHPGMKLWDEALLRGTSVYMIDTVIPMIPHKLSNGICSLNEGVDRLAFSCIMEVTPRGEIVNYDFVDTIINSRKAMTYEAVNEIFEEGNLPEGYEEFYDNLVLMNNLSNRLEKIKEKRGYVNFGTNDLEIVRDEEGKPLSFKQRRQRTAEKIIENLMLLAGECYANYMVIPTPLRVHEKPDEDRVEEAFELLEKSGIRVKSCQDISNGKVLQQILKQIENIDERTIAANILLRSMKRARYDVSDVGHFGLGLENYGHWTSPIRRAADLRGHYNLRIQRDNMGYIKDYEKFTEEMEKFCYHISKTERNADNAEQEANQYEMTRYVLNHIGEKFECRVTYISPRVIFVKTIDGIDGKIVTEDIKGDSFRFSDEAFAFVGKKSKKRIKIGTQLVVTAIDATQDLGSVAFGIDSEDLKLIKGRKSKAV